MKIKFMGVDYVVCHNSECGRHDYTNNICCLYGPDNMPLKPDGKPDCKYDEYGHMTKHQAEEGL